jgi:hypothetical protein
MVPGAETAQITAAASGDTQDSLQPPNVTRCSPRLPATPRRHALDAVENHREFSTRLPYRQSATGRTEVEIATRLVQALEQRSRLPQHGPTPRHLDRPSSVARATHEPRFQTARIVERLDEE